MPRSNSAPESATDKLLRGLVAGVVAGAVASFAMDRFQAAVTALSTTDDEEEPATEKAADAISTRLTGAKVPAAGKPLAGQAVHYALGFGLGVVYAVTAEFRPAVTSAYGSAFGIGTATLLDEIAVPIAGLGEAPWESDRSALLYGYASHLVFGVVVEGVRRQLRATLLA